MRKSTLLAGLVVASLSAAAFSQLPEAQSISAQDKATGAKAHPDLLAEYGGAYAGPQADYVARVGRRVAGQSGIANVNRDFTFTLLNSPVENAFAIPGGYVYCTRQLLALMNDEAELAFVLGHETGHIAAHHADQRNSVAQRDVLLGSLGQAVLGAILGNGQLGQKLGQFGTSGINRLVVGNVMHHSRQQEFEADDLGVGFADRAGYDPLAAPDMLTSLAAQEALDKRISGNARITLRWAMSHPDPGSRVGRALALARQQRPASSYRNNDALLMSLKGMLYGDDPRQGVIDGQTFKYPDTGFRFTAPAGYGMENGTDAVTIGGMSGNVGGQARFSGGRYDGTLDGYVGKVLAGLSKNAAAPAMTRGAINGMETATARVRGQDGSGRAVDVTIVAYAFAPGTAYSFVVLQPQGAGLGDLAPLVQSFSRMTAAEAAAVRPRIVDVVTVQRGDSVASLAAQMAYTDLKADRFRVLNGLSPEATALTPGRKVKLIVWGTSNRS
ncbi:M48 family metalloprotease [uncultured Sphingomonas sp.]|uniref:M48 family metalloprotease n=1 Tax=uncultured Sphingomonas sp. TaxID=158754 RepID=UPI00262FC7D0|nr:M48 family metalloprotease [uncultured Sphingomonas sp.]